MKYLDITRRTGDLKIVFSAELASVDIVCKEAKMFLNNLNIQKDFEVILPLREALINAVIHGCREDSRKRVICEVKSKDFMLIIRVKDRGEGFDWSDFNGEIPQSNELNGRGISIIKHYSTSFKFNKKGNEIIILKNVLALMGV